MSNQLLAPVQAPNLSEWVDRLRAAQRMKIHTAMVPDAVVKYGIGNQLMFGRRMYYVYDVERAAEAIEKMRAEREARKAAV